MKAIYRKLTFLFTRIWNLCPVIVGRLVVVGGKTLQWMFVLVSRRSTGAANASND